MGEGGGGGRRWRVVGYGAWVKEVVEKRVQGGRLWWTGEGGGGRGWKVVGYGGWVMEEVEEGARWFAMVDGRRRWWRKKVQGGWLWWMGEGGGGGRRWKVVGYGGWVKEVVEEEGARWSAMVDGWWRWSRKKVQSGWLWWTGDGGGGGRRWKVVGYGGRVMEEVEESARWLAMVDGRRRWRRKKVEGGWLWWMGEGGGGGRSWKVVSYGRWVKEVVEEEGARWPAMVDGWWRSASRFIPALFALIPKSHERFAHTDRVKVLPCCRYWSAEDEAGPMVLPGESSVEALPQGSECVNRQMEEEREKAVAARNQIRNQWRIMRDKVAKDCEQAKKLADETEAMKEKRDKTRALSIKEEERCKSLEMALELACWQYCEQLQALEVEIMSRLRLPSQGMKPKDCYLIPSLTNG
ncbi:hypothetical protein CBR_g39389 [Chara braunii]|uniref:Uncharacterized protein n=1 Tax=Chara braunii TaxID=69332 RepID=A0A388LRJ2_CHABU|nr:hypothetical protein CBR_g39389 [Chara braunii]|eukprot:GBG84927.1 hypothetical protein CBR_g39389 [Chara braunii]